MTLLYIFSKLTPSCGMKWRQRNPSSVVKALKTSPRMYSNLKSSRLSPWVFQWIIQKHDSSDGFNIEICSWLWKNRNRPPVFLHQRKTLCSFESDECLTKIWQAMLTCVPGPKGVQRSLPIVQHQPIAIHNCWFHNTCWYPFSQHFMIGLLNPS